MSNNNNKQLGEAPWLHVIISTGLGAGFVPKAPGTAGAFLALLIWIGLYYVLSPIGLMVATILLVVSSLLSLNIPCNNRFCVVWSDRYN